MTLGLENTSLHRATAKSVEDVGRQGGVDDAKLQRILELTSEDVEEAKELLAGVRSARGRLVKERESVERQLEARQAEADQLRAAGVVVPEKLGDQISHLRARSRELKGRTSAVSNLDTALTQETDALPLVASAKRALELGIIKKGDFRALTDGKLSWINERLTTHLVKLLFRQSAAMDGSEHISAEEQAAAHEKVQVASNLLRNIAMLRRDPSKKGDNLKDLLAFLASPHRMAAVRRSLSLETSTKMMNVVNAFTAMLLTPMLLDSVGIVGDVGVDLPMGGPAPGDSPLDVALLVLFALHTAVGVHRSLQKRAAKEDPNSAAMLEANRKIAWARLGET